MFSGFMMTPTSHGIREGSKANTSDEAKVKEEKRKRKRQRRTKVLQSRKEKAEEKEEGKAALTW